MTYPFSPAILDAMPEELAELFRNLEVSLLKEITDRLVAAGELNEVTIQNIRALRSHGIGIDQIRREISRVTGIGEGKLLTLFKDVVDRNQAYYNGLATLSGISAPELPLTQADIDSIIAQTSAEYANITRSMGFLVDGGRTKLPPAQAYQWALDNAAMQIQSGGISYNQAIANATRQLADSGLNVINYESGHRDQVDVAVRRAVMTGINQLNSQFVIADMEALGTDFVEVSAHAGARDKDGANVWDNHKNWQGKVYHWALKSYGDGTYPDFVESCGYGDVTGILGANCRHSFSPFIPGVMERTYTDEQLANIDPPPFEYQGKKYTHYEATQKQREIERTVRKWERRRAAAANDADRQDCEIRIRRLKKMYKDFSSTANLRTQPERMKVYVPQGQKPPSAPPKPVQPTQVTPPTQTPPQPQVTHFNSAKLQATLGNDYTGFAKRVARSEARPMFEAYSESATYKQFKGAGTFRSATNSIEWDFETHKGRDKYSTLAHESGHLFDYSIGKDKSMTAQLSYKESDALRAELGAWSPMRKKASHCDEFLAAIRSDMEKLNADLANVAADMKATARNASNGVQDALDGFYGTQAKNILPWGHGNKYYNRAFRNIESAGKYNETKTALQSLGMAVKNKDDVKAIIRQYEAASEAWANITSAVTVGGAEFDAIQKWMPDSLAAYQSIVGRLF